MVLTETLADAAAAEAGVKSGVIVQVVPAGSGLVQLLDTLNCVFDGVIAPRKGEDRVAGTVPELVTVNTPVQATLLPEAGHPEGVPATPEAVPRLLRHGAERNGGVLPVHDQDLLVPGVRDIQVAVRIQGKAGRAAQPTEAESERRIVLVDHGRGLPDRVA